MAVDVTAAMSESVELEGTLLDTPEFLVSYNDAKLTRTIQWGLESLLEATPAKSAVLLERQEPENSEWKVAARAGIVPTSTVIPDTTPILARVGSPGNTKETYLPTVQALPGKKELTYLPSNTQLALLIPIDNGKVLVLAGNTAKSFTPRDVAWSRIVAERLGNP